MRESSRSYAKGVMKRREILSSALRLIGDQGFSETTLRDIANDVGLSQAGVLHYFDSVDDLYVQILRERDAFQSERVKSFLSRQSLRHPSSEPSHSRRADTGTTDEPYEPSLDDAIEAFLALMQENLTTPGLVELYSRMQAAAADPGHPAHAYFRERRSSIPGFFMAIIDKATRQGGLNPGWDPDTAVRIVTALADGLQLQWLQDNEVDVAGILKEFFRSIRRPPASPGANDSRHTGEPKTVKTS